MKKIDLQRYQRQILLPEIGEKGQEKIFSARVLIVGVGGLGSPAALYLAAAGVGTLGLVDDDIIQISNLQRQILYGTNETNLKKIDMAKGQLERLNPDVKIELHPTFINHDNVLKIVERYDIVVDATDQFGVRYLLNDVCSLLGKPLIYGSVFRFEGQVGIFCLPTKPCYACLFREPPTSGESPSCDMAGVLGVMPGIIGIVQASECLKLIAGVGDLLAGKLASIDLLSNKYEVLEIQRQEDCPYCQKTRKKTLISKKPVACSDSGVEEITHDELRQLFENVKKPILIDVRSKDEHAKFKLPYPQKLISLDVLNTTVVSDIDLNATIIVYCHAGVRSLSAAVILKNIGFVNVRSLRGGVESFFRN